MTGPIEQKVTASSIGAALAGAVIWLLGEHVFAGQVPEPIVALVLVIVPGLAAFASGFAAPHTWRTDPEARQHQPPTPPGEG